MDGGEGGDLNFTERFVVGLGDIMKLFAAGQNEGVGIGVFFNCYKDVAVEEK